MGEAIKAGEAPRGILICGSGVGVCVAANKIPGIRAGMCHDTYSAHQGVEHDDMNVLVLGARIIGSALAFELVDAFIGAKFIAREERFTRRFKKVLAIEAKYMCGDGGQQALDSEFAAQIVGGSQTSHRSSTPQLRTHTERRRCSPST